MKKFLGIGFLLTTLTLNSCKKCKNPEHVPRAKLMEEYFGNYKPGAYWIYLNRDSTKRDSVWVDNYKTRQIRDMQFNCRYAEEISFDIHNQYMWTSDTQRVALGFNGNDLNTNVFIILDSLDRGSPGFYASDGTANFYHGSVHFPVVYNYSLWSTTPSFVIPQVSVINRLVITPDLGIIQYLGFNLTDTFSLVKYHLP